MVNVCMVGHGMMGIWHSEALRNLDECRLHTVVGRPKAPDPTPAPAPASAEGVSGEGAPSAGRKPASTEQFAAKYGYKKWTTDFDAAVRDPEVDVVIVAGPSETHAEMSLAALEQGKHVLVEIPIAMNLAGAGAVVAAAAQRGLTLGVVHPMRFRTERQPIVDRIGRGEERVSHVQGRFFIHRLANVGATGLQRTWTDNLLWHHTTHLIDFGLWVVSGGDHPISSEQQNAELIAPDFINAVAKGEEPAVPGWSVLPAMRILDQVQSEWDERHGAQALPGRPVV